MYNPVVLEQRKYDEEFDRHTDIDRFKINCRNISNPINSSAIDPGSTLITPNGVCIVINLPQIIMELI